tara:strand:- start:832 stop:1035 length:204 start_codon:yes stop_codon:yes gene_type:complete
MSPEQHNYIKTFLCFFSNGENLLDWDDEEVKEATLDRAKSMRANVATLSDRFSENEWIEILDFIIES